LREADVVVSTSTGASDPRLLAACGLSVDDDEMLRGDGRVVDPGKKRWGVKGAITSESLDKPLRVDAPDGLPPISLPYVIVDEACQSVEPATLIPLTASNSCRALVLLGDPCQLPATVKSDPNSELAVSLMERLAATLPQPTTNMQADSTEKDTTYLDALPIKQARSLLRSLQSEERIPAVYRKRFAGSLLLGIQYRMHPSIAAFSSAMFYDGLLTTPALLGSRRTFPRVLRDAMPCGDRELGVRMIHVGGRCNEKRGEQNPLSGYRRTGTVASLLESTTYYNEAEAERVLSVIKRIVSGKDKNDPFAPKTIGVVTPYSGQVQLIKSMIASDAELQALQGFSATIEVKSVDGYQGRERDVIIFSAVRSNRQGKVGFLSDWRRLNVAMTRARNALIVVGDLDSLAEGDKHWAAFGKWCQGVRCIMDDTEDPDECASV
jgi:superfamily I DNA and/or RNA helicase